MTFRHRPHRGASGRREAGERGETLIEVIATTILLGTSVIALVSMMFTLLVLTSSHRRVIRTTNEATTIAEAIDAMPYTNCFTGSTTGPNYAASVPATLLSSVDSVTYSFKFLQVPTTSPVTLPQSTWGTTCPASGDRGAQQITVTVTSGGAQPATTRSITFVKRKDTCPAGVSTRVC